MRAAAARLTENSDISVLVTYYYGQDVSETSTIYQCHWIYVCLIIRPAYQKCVPACSLIFAASLGNYDKHCHLW